MEIWESIKYERKKREQDKATGSSTKDVIKNNSSDVWKLN